jgi:hypothetical protein
MTIRGLLKFSPVGLALQILVHVFGAVLGAGVGFWHFLGNVYLPWVMLGGILDTFSGTGGHAFQGGGILGYLLGILIYSLLLGAVICYFCEDRRVK